MSHLSQIVTTTGYRYPVFNVYYNLFVSVTRLLPCREHLRHTYGVNFILVVFKAFLVTDKVIESIIKEITYLRGARKNINF